MGNKYKEVRSYIFESTIFLFHDSTSTLLSYPKETLMMIEKNKQNMKSNYPFAIVGVNLCLLLIDLLNLRDHKYLTTQAGYWEVFEDKNSFFEVFNFITVNYF